MKEPLLNTKINFQNVKTVKSQRHKNTFYIGMQDFLMVTVREVGVGHDQEIEQEWLLEKYSISCPDRGGVTWVCSLQKHSLKCVTYDSSTFLYVCYTLIRS